MKSIKLVCSYFVFFLSILGAAQSAYAQTDSFININTASVEELQQMKGVGETRAQAIVAYRDQNGPFEQVDDLLEVNGIGESTLARNQDVLKVD
jgi:competence protein ComEA